MKKVYLLFLFLLLATSGKALAFDWLNELLGYESSSSPISYKRARAIVPGKTIFASSDKFMFRLRDEIITWKTKHQWTQFRSSFTGKCGIKGYSKPKVPGAKSSTKKALSRSLNIPVEEKYCKYIDLAFEIKKTIGSCPVGDHVEQSRRSNGALEYTAIKMTSDCKCLRQYYLEAKIPSQEGNRIKYTTQVFQPYTLNTLSFVDYGKCERFFDQDLGRFDELMDIANEFNHFRSSRYYRENTSGSRSSKNRYFNILTGMESKW